MPPILLNLLVTLTQPYETGPWQARYYQDYTGQARTAVILHKHSQGALKIITTQTEIRIRATDSNGHTLPSKTLPLAHPESIPNAQNHLHDQAQTILK